MKFKVGDRVKFTYKPRVGYFSKRYSAASGSVCTVSKVYRYTDDIGGNSYDITTRDGQLLMAYADELEKVK